MYTCVYLLIFAYIYFTWLCASWLPFFYMMHAWLLCSLEILTYWLHWLILLPILAYWLFLLYDYFICLDTCILIVVYLVHLDMLISFVVYYLDYFLACYLSRLSCFLLSLFVDMDDIPITWLLFFYLMHALLVSVGNKSISLPLIPSLGQPCFLWFFIWYETCCLALLVSSTKLVIRSRV